MSRSKILEIESEFGELIDKLLHRLHWQEDMPVVHIAEFLRISRSTATRWIKRYEIPIRSISQDNERRYRYMTEDQKKEQTRKANEKMRVLGEIGQNPLQRYQRENGSWFKGKTQNNNDIVRQLADRKRGSGNPMWNQWESTWQYKDGHKSYRNWAFRRYGFEKKCELCGETMKLHVHHKNSDRTNNKKENLAILCPKCHAMCHHSNPMKDIIQFNGWEFLKEVF